MRRCPSFASGAPALPWMRCSEPHLIERLSSGKRSTAHRHAQARKLRSTVLDREGRSKRPSTRRDRSVRTTSSSVCASSWVSRGASIASLRRRHPRWPDELREIGICHDEMASRSERVPTPVTASAHGVPCVSGGSDRGQHPRLDLFGDRARSFITLRHRRDGDTPGSRRPSWSPSAASREIVSPTPTSHGARMAQMKISIETFAANVCADL